MPDDGNLQRARTGGATGLIERYEAIAAVSRQMLAAARADDWTEVARLEACCRELIAELKQLARSQRLSVAEQRRRIELLRGILADDAEIRLRAEPWLRQLERLLAARAPRRAPRG
jgi:flagellar protein FliT